MRSVESKKARELQRLRENQMSDSCWHGIMHRREPDPDNAKYWFRRVGQHPVLARLETESALLGYQYQGPLGFIDFCERVRDTGSAEETLARKVQRLEWQLLFDWCLRRARGDR